MLYITKCKLSHCLLIICYKITLACVHIFLIFQEDGKSRNFVTFANFSFKKFYQYFAILFKTIFEEKKIFANTCTCLFSRVISLITVGGSSGLMNHFPLMLLCRMRPLLNQKISSLCLPVSLLVDQSLFEC